MMDPNQSEYSGDNGVPVEHYHEQEGVKYIGDYYDKLRQTLSSDEKTQKIKSKKN